MHGAEDDRNRPWNLRILRISLPSFNMQVAGVLVVAFVVSVVVVFVVAVIVVVVVVDALDVIFVVVVAVDVVVAFVVAVAVDVVVAVDFVIVAVVIFVVIVVDTGDVVGLHGGGRDGVVCGETSGGGERRCQTSRLPNRMLRGGSEDPVTKCLDQVVCGESFRRRYAGEEIGDPSVMSQDQYKAN